MNKQELKKVIIIIAIMILLVVVMAIIMSAVIPDPSGGYFTEDAKTGIQTPVTSLQYSICIGVVSLCIVALVGYIINLIKRR
ncbi:MAG: hypothetical protein R3Y32_08015 [Bacillota bacterium]